MVKKQLVLTNPNGFHMRPASEFASAMGKYKSDVTVRFEGANYNGKSLLNLIAACIKCGCEVEVICSGEDENEALAKAEELISGADAENLS